MYYSISFNKVIKWLPNAKNPKKFNTLGDESFIVCYKPNNQTIIAIGSTGTYHLIDKNYWDERCRLINKMSQEERKHGKNFSNGINRNFGPTVPALCRAYCEEHLNVTKDCIIK